MPAVGPFAAAIPDDADTVTIHIETTPIGIRDVAELHPLDELVEWIQALEREGELPAEVQR